MTCLADRQSFGKLLISKKCEISIFSQTVLKMWLLNTARSANVWQFHGTFLVLN